VRLEGLGKLKNIHLIGNQIRDLQACSTVPQPTTLPRAPGVKSLTGLNWLMNVRNFGEGGGSKLCGSELWYASLTEVLLFNNTEVCNTPNPYFAFRLRGIKYEILKATLFKKQTPS
jgi:hypothetical protein